MRYAHHEPYSETALRWGRYAAEASRDGNWYLAYAVYACRFARWHSEGAA